MCGHLKFGLSQVLEMQRMQDAGASLKLIAREFESTPDRVTKYLNNYRRYGESFFTRYPKEVDR